MRVCWKWQGQRWRAVPAVFCLRCPSLQLPAHGVFVVGDTHPIVATVGKANKAFVGSLTQSVVTLSRVAVGVAPFNVKLWRPVG